MWAGAPPTNLLEFMAGRRRAELIQREAAMAVNFPSCTKFRRKHRLCMSLACQGG
jgi:ribosomal protein L32